jgi:hypothetical protein
MRKRKNVRKDGISGVMSEWAKGIWFRAIKKNRNGNIEQNFSRSLDIKGYKSQSTGHWKLKPKAPGGKGTKAIHRLQLTDEGRG